MTNLHDAITAHADGPLVTKWIVVAEVVTEEGPRKLQMYMHPDLTPWDRIGLLQVAYSRTFLRLSGGAQ